MAKATKLPKLTPASVVQWAKEMEAYHPLGVLPELPEDATLEEIKEAYDQERITLQGIGEAIEELGKTDMWPEPEFD